MTSFPNFISWILVYSLCFMLFSSDGQIIGILVRIGIIDNPTNLLANADIAYIFQTILTVWKGLLSICLPFPESIQNCITRRM